MKKNEIKREDKMIKMTAFKINYFDIVDEEFDN